MSAWLAPLITGILSTLVTALYLRQRYLRGLALQIERLKNQLSVSEQQLANSQASEGELRDQLLQVLVGLLENDRLVNLRQHEQEHDRAEAATDAVEKRQAESLDSPVLLARHVTASPC